MIEIYRYISGFVVSSLRKPVIRKSFFYLMGIIILSTGLFAVSSISTTYRYKIGDMAEEDIRVPADIQFTIESETEVKKTQEGEMVPLVFDRDHALLLERLGIIASLFEFVAVTLKENPPIGTDDRSFQLAALKTRLPKYIDYGDAVLLELLRYKKLNELKSTINRILIYLYDGGCMDAPYANPLKINNKNVTIRTINTAEEINEVSTTIDKLKTIDEVRREVFNISYSTAPNLNRDVLNAVSAIVRGNMRANLRFNPEETRRRIQEKVRTVKPLLGILKKGQIIVRDGDTITTDTYKRIQILNRHTSKTNVNYIAGVFLIQFLFLLIFGYFIVMYYEHILHDRNTPVIVFSLLAFFICYTFFIYRVTDTPSSELNFALLLPIPFIGMIIAILFNFYLAALIGLYTVFFASWISGLQFPVLALSFSSALIGAFVVGDVRSRTNFLQGGFVIGFLNALIVIAAGLMSEQSFNAILKNIGLSFANGMINAILALGIIPLYENIFGITTKFRLLELSDLNAPIFKRMLIRAPGTYNHSLMVANLAEAACIDIGANALLARVGGYYHDIGKIENANIYIENKLNDRGPQSLTPREYSRLIISHIEKGVELGKKNGLPESVTGFIREHHGKSTMTYFYHQALELVNSSSDSDDINKSDFQYPGPKPHSKESAVVLLADSIEAASRSLQDISYVKLEGLVKKIIYNKLNEGELEYSDLTMAELNKIQKAFLKILFGIFHTRIEYPEKEEVERLEGIHSRKINGM